MYVLHLRGGDAATNNKNVRSHHQRTTRDRGLLGPWSWGANADGRCGPLPAHTREQHRVWTNKTVRMGEDNFMLLCEMNVLKGWRGRKKVDIADFVAMRIVFAVCRFSGFLFEQKRALFQVSQLEQYPAWKLSYFKIILRSNRIVIQSLDGHQNEGMFKNLSDWPKATDRSFFLYLHTRQFSKNGNLNC